MRILHLLLATCTILSPAVGHSQTAENPNSGGFRSWLHQLHRDSEYPIISAELGVIGLVREQPDSQILAFDENLVTLFNADQLQGSMQFGFEALIDTYEFFPQFGGVDWQWGYFGINSMDAETTVAAEPFVQPWFFNRFAAEPESSLNIIYSSNLYSGETNFRFRSRRRIRPVVGLRYFKLEDSYDAFHHGTGSFSQEGFFSATNNKLFGGQFGAETDFWITRFTKVYANGKYGAMYNTIDGSATAADPVSGDDLIRYFSDSSYSSFVDAGVGLVTEFAGGLSFRVGYRTIFASHLALGIDQNEAIDILGSGDAIVAYNSQQWHGLDLTAILAY